MGGVTAAPWSIPYPTGTDRVADGDNAMQAIAERVAAICNQLPRGLVVSHYAAGGWTIGDATPITLPAYAISEYRDLFATIEFDWQSPTPGSGFYGRLQDNGAQIARFDYSQAQPALQKLNFFFRIINAVPGSHTYSFNTAAWAANGGLLSNPTFSIWDMGVNGAI